MGVLTTYTMKVTDSALKQPAALKDNRVLSMVHRQFTGSFLIIYKGFVRPHLEYAIQIWCPYEKVDI